MKSICFDSLKREKLRFQKPPKPKSLDPSWYTDNIYSNHSIDLDEDYIPDCLKYNHNYRKLRDINENDEYNNHTTINRNITNSNGELDRSIYNSPSHHHSHLHSSRYSPRLIQRSKSCKDFKIQQQPSSAIKSRSCCFGGYDPLLHSHQNKIKSIKVQVPKSYSFSGGNRGNNNGGGVKIRPFDIMDYDLPIDSVNRREKKSARKAPPLLNYYCNEPKIRCWEHCTNSKCLLEEICNNYNRNKMNRDSNDRRAIRRNIIAEWEERNRQRRPSLPPPTQIRYSNSCDEHCYRRQGSSNKRRACCTSDYNLMEPADDSSYEDEYCPANGGHYHRRSNANINYYDTDLDHFIRDERSRLLNQDKFLDDDEIFLSNTNDNYQPPPPTIRNKSMLEVQPPNKYDDTDDDDDNNDNDDNGSESTEMELEDFNFDIERYWEELDKPPSPIDLDMQERNMNKNMKIKNVNVGCYNNGMPITDHDRKQERLMIKKSLLEGMPSPPQQTILNPSLQNNITSSDGCGGAGEFMNYFYQNGSPTFQGHNHHHNHQQRHRYTSHKIYPIESRPIYKYNNFYPNDSLHNNHHVNNINNSNNNHTNNNHISSNPISLINNIFSIYKPNKYSPLNCQLNKSSTTGIISKKMNIPSTIRPLGAIPPSSSLLSQQHLQHHHHQYQTEYLTNSMKRPLIVSTEQPHFKIIPEKTGLKISPFFEYGNNGDQKKNIKHNKLKSTNRPLIFPH